MSLCQKIDDLSILVDNDYENVKKNKQKINN